MPNESNWGEYSKLVLKELERLNENYESIRTDIAEKFQDLNQKLSDMKGIEKSVNDQKIWIEKVNDVWSTSQMKEAKDEIYKQKSRWIAFIAVVSFVQILVGLLVVIWAKMQ